MQCDVAEKFEKEREQLHSRIRELEGVISQMVLEKHRTPPPREPIMLVTDGRRRLRIFADSRQSISKVRVVIREFMDKNNGS